MKKTEESPEGYVYAPWIPVTTKSFVNGIQVLDCLWWKNILCKINWFFRFRKRKQSNKYKKTKIDAKYYGTNNVMQNSTEYTSYTVDEYVLKYDHDDFSRVKTEKFDSFEEAVKRLKTLDLNDCFNFRLYHSTKEVFNINKILES